MYSSRVKLYSYLLAGALLAACGDDSGDDGMSQADANTNPPEADAAPEIDIAALRTQANNELGTLPASFASDTNPSTEAKVTLGRALYYETRLSKNHDISCNTCHALDQYGVDGDPTSTGHRGQVGGRNAPVVYNAAGQLAQFWDGRAPDVEAQAKGPILNPIEMAMPSEEAVVAVLESIPGYVEMFAAAFPEEATPITYDNLALAIGAFERGLVTPAPFDAWLQGDDTAMSERAVNGLKLFLDIGCASCHSGALLGGNQYRKYGEFVAVPGLDDEGRILITNEEADRFVFKVPILRNIMETDPYMNDGSVETIATAVGNMVQYQLDRAPLTNNEMGDLLLFLTALTGELPADYIAEPALPASGPNTPPPDPN